MPDAFEDPSPAIAVLVMASPGQAYLGPGLGMGAAATAIGVVASVLIGLFAIVWYPMKRLVRRVTRRDRRR